MKNITDIYPEWNETGEEPDQDKRDNGWEASEKPPAAFFNWFWYTVSQSFEDIDAGVADRMADMLTDGVIKGGEITENDSPDLSVVVEPLTGYYEGARLYTPNDNEVDLEDYIPSSDEKWVSIYAEDNDTDVIFNIVEGDSGSDPDKPALDDSQGVLLADVLLDSDMDEINNEDINEGRKEVVNKNISNTGMLYAENYPGENGREKIQNAVNAGKEINGMATIFVGSKGPDADNEWHFDKAIEIPDNTTLILNNCHLYLKDDVNDNIFRNENLDGNKNIHIFGIGMPWLDGNAENQDRDVYGEKQEESYRYDGIFFCNVDNFTIQNLMVGPTHAWGICPQKCTNWKIKNIKFNQDGSTNNQDGITVSVGAENAEIEDIYGKTGDDTVALTTHNSMDFVNPEYPDGDIKHIKISNIHSKVLGGHNTFRLLCADGNTISHIDVDGVTDITTEEDIVNSGTQINAVVTINDDITGYGDTPAEKFDLEKVNISNVRGYAEDIIRIQGVIFDVSFDNITGYQPVKNLIHFVEIANADYPDTAEDFETDGVFFTNLNIKTRAGVTGWENAGTFLKIGKNQPIQNVYLDNLTMLSAFQFLELDLGGDYANKENMFIDNVPKYFLGGYPFNISNYDQGNIEIKISNIGDGKSGQGTDYTKNKFYTNDVLDHLKLYGENIPPLTEDDDGPPKPREGQKMFWKENANGNTNPEYVIGDGDNWRTIIELD